ncbi:pyridoxal phosphate-dependent aminotransferase [Halopelagius longus]|uniref:Aminotransferase n=1 Tax=Halopelagius longus TaxID=1236180 RepID=A0A1H1AA05_9EURY|nr:pyridoxal phosphate-dependent aminotransferase [Halopelagius longus]RDI70298.1 pyridoxal phosphate-dependent aminotransferase [Halopelagius longus]SDQ36477.1 Aspartate/methionine/tyrosine aminotransferase [Halopelagius longus]
MFPTLPYLEWIDGRTEAAEHDFGSSDLRSSADDGAVVPEPLRGRSVPDDTSLRARVAAEYDADEENVLVTAGATQANFLAAAAAIDLASTPDADRRPQVLAEKPGYQPLVVTPEAFGARVDRFLRPDEEGFPLDPNRISNAVSDAFALAVATNRHNPSGNLSDRETVAEAARACGDADGYLLVDEVYAPYVRDDDEGASSVRAFGGPTGAGLPNTVVTGSLTKFYGLGGLRVGWLIGPTELVERAREVAYHLSPVAEPSRRLARRAVHDASELTASARDHLAENHELLESFLADHEALSGRVHSGSPFALLSHADATGDEFAAAAWDRDILVVPGRFFNRPDHFRLALGRPPEEMAAGLDALSEVVESFAESE